MAVAYEAKEGAWETEVASMPIRKKYICLVGQELGEVKYPACLSEEKPVRSHHQKQKKFKHLQ